MGLRECLSDHGAEKQRFERTTAVRTHHDEVTAFLFGDARDTGRGVSDEMPFVETHLRLEEYSLDRA